MEHFPISSAFLRLIAPKIWKLKTSRCKIVKRISYHTWHAAWLYLPKHTIRSQWAPLVWRVKMNFISNKSLNHGTISRFKCFHTPCRTRDMKRKIQNFPSRNLQKKRIGHHTWHVCCLYYNSLAKSESRLHLQLMHSIVLVRLCFT